MKNAEIIHRRLINQQIGYTKFSKPTEIVSWLGAMQAQEYQMAKWAIGLRLASDPQNVTIMKDSDIETEFNEGRILRTHLLRPTWHFIAAEDIRWLLRLTAPRVRQANAFMNRKMELDEQIFNKSNQIIARELKGGHYLTRTALQKALSRKKISGDGVRLSLLMMQAELDGVICSGPRIGNQFTYALLDERVPAPRKLLQEEALIELTRRYFMSRGPASLQDYVTWSGLTVALCKRGIAALENNLSKVSINRREYYFDAGGFDVSIPIKKIQSSFLMPDYDEYGISYKDRSTFFDPSMGSNSLKGGSPVYNRMIVIDGRIRGSWKRTFVGGAIKVEAIPFTALNKRESKELELAVNRYRRFIS